MAAEGAFSAYEQVIGETWKPFDRPVEYLLGRMAQRARHLQIVLQPMLDGRNERIQLGPPDW